MHEDSHGAPQGIGFVATAAGEGCSDVRPALIKDLSIAGAYILLDPAMPVTESKLTELTVGIVRTPFQYFSRVSNIRPWEQRRKCLRYERLFQSHPNPES